MATHNPPVRAGSIVSARSPLAARGRSDKPTVALRWGPVTRPSAELDRNTIVHTGGRDLFWNGLLKASGHLARPRRQCDERLAKPLSLGCS